MSKPTLYLETTIPSFLTARASNSILAKSHQRITRSWWDEEREKYHLLVSEIVLNEALKGDPKAAALRMSVLEGIHRLPTPPGLEKTSVDLMRELRLPIGAAVDSLHLAFVMLHKIEYMLTWNCRHLAHVVIRERVRQFGERNGLNVPMICTPEELMS